MSRSSRPTEVPGATTPQEQAPEDHVRGTDSPEVLRLRAENEALLKRLAERPAVPDLPQVVYTPETPHGKAAREASACAHLTTKQVMDLIDTGEMREPLSSVLCLDGYYVRRS